MKFERHDSQRNVGSKYVEPDDELGPDEDWEDLELDDDYEDEFEHEDSDDVWDGEE